MSETQNHKQSSDFSQFTDEELIAALREKNPPEREYAAKAFATIYERYHDRMIHYLYGFVYDLQIAEDLYQELMLKLHRNHVKFRVQDKFSSWIYRIASNTAITYIRKQKNRDSIASETALDSLEIDFFDERVEDPQEQSLRNETAQIIAEHISRLPDKFKVVFLLRLQDNKTYNEIAEIVKISERTAKWRMKRAIELLKNELADNVYEADDLT